MRCNGDLYSFGSFPFPLSCTRMSMRRNKDIKRNKAFKMSFSYRRSNVFMIWIRFCIRTKKKIFSKDFTQTCRLLAYIWAGTTGEPMCLENSESLIIHIPKYVSMYVHIVDELCGKSIHTLTHSDTCKDFLANFTINSY